MILIVEDDKTLGMALQTLFESQGLSSRLAHSLSEARTSIGQQSAPLKGAIVDYHLPDGLGSEVMRELQQLDARTMIIAFSGDRGSDSFQDSLNSGALVHLGKDVDPSRILETMKRMIRDYDQKYGAHGAKNDQSLESLGLIGESESLKNSIALINKYAKSELPVLIRGENGTGKDLMAMALHKSSPRNHGPFVAVNCASLSSELLASELFGHKKGSFTGALQDKIGKFEAANNGTLFLDEIGDMPIEAQASLLRALQSNEIVRVGEVHPRKVNVRIVAATNANLETSIKENRFRMDLFYRLNALPIRLSPLRERQNDIELITNHVLSQWNKENKSLRSLHQDVIKNLSEQAWPGNIRELIHFVRLMLVMSDAQVITRVDYLKARDLDHSSSVADNTPTTADPLISYQVWMTQTQETEIAMIRQALAKSQLNQSVAAEILGISRSHLRSRMRALGIT